MDAPLSPRNALCDSLRVQVAAVAAQHAAVTEQEIRLEGAREQFVSEQRSLLANVETLILHLLAREEHFDRRQSDLRSRENFVSRLENACARLARELELTERTLATEPNATRRAA